MRVPKDTTFKGVYFKPKGAGEVKVIYALVGALVMFDVLASLALLSLDEQAC